MTVSRTADIAGFAVPAFTVATLVTILVGGAIATVAFDLFGQAISPMLGFASLAPVPLATQTWGVIFGEPYGPGGHLLHYMAGLLAYPIGWLYVWKPLAQRFVPSLNWLASSALYGVGLWVFALYVMAHLVAGNPAFLNFTGITWVALVGHVLFAVVFALVERLRTREA